MPTKKKIVKFIFWKNKMTDVKNIFRLNRKSDIAKERIFVTKNIGSKNIKAKTQREIKRLEYTV